MNKQQQQSYRPGNNGFEFDFMFEAQKLKEQSSFFSRTVCMDELTLPATRQPCWCSCGAVELDSVEAETHICTGSIIEHLQQGWNQFPTNFQKSRGRERNTTARPRSSTCKLLLTSLKVQSRNKSRHSSGNNARKSQSKVTQEDVDDGCREQQSGSGEQSCGLSSKRVKLELDSVVSLTSSSPDIIRNEFDYVTQTKSIKNNNSTKEALWCDDDQQHSGGKSVMYLKWEDLCPSFTKIPEYLGTIEGESFIQSARRGFLLFQIESGVDYFEATPGAGRNRMKNCNFKNPTSRPTTPCCEMNINQEYQQGHGGMDWTPFVGVDLLTGILQVMTNPTKVVEENVAQTMAVNQEQIEQQHYYDKDQDIRAQIDPCSLEQIIQTEEIKVEEEPSPKKVTWAHTISSKFLSTDTCDTGVASHSKEEQHDPSSSIEPNNNDLNSHVLSSSPSKLRKDCIQIEQTLSFPLLPSTSEPRTPILIASKLASYSHHLCSRPGPSGKPIIEPIPPLFSSLETFPPLCSTIFNHNTKDKAKNPSPIVSRTTTPTTNLIPVSDKPRIPSLMDLKLSPPLESINACSSNSPTLINNNTTSPTNRKGSKLPLQTLFDSIHPSVFNHPVAKLSTKSKKIKKASSSSQANNNSGSSTLSPVEALRAICSRTDNQATTSAAIQPENDAAVRDVLREISFAGVAESQQVVKVIKQEAEDEEQEDEEEECNYSCSEPDLHNYTTNNNDNEDSSSSDEDESDYYSVQTTSSLEESSESNNNSRTLNVSSTSRYQYFDQNLKNPNLVQILNQSQPLVHNSSLIQEFDFNNFIKNWSKTKTSMICLDATTGTIKYERISAIFQDKQKNC